MTVVAAQAPAGTRRRWSARARDDAIIGYLFLGPWILGFLIWTIYPMIYSFYLSFTKYNILTPPKFIGLDNFKFMFSEEVFWQALKVTTINAVVSVPLGVIAGYTIALILNQNVKGLSIWRVIYYMPAIVPTLATAYLFSWLFNKDIGLINGLLRQIGIVGPGWFSSRFWVLPTFWIMSLWGAGGGMILYLAALQGVPTELYEAAMLDGANAWQKFIHVTIPMTSPVILFTTLMGIIGSFQVFTGSYIITGGGPADASLFYVLYLYNNAWQQAKMGYGAALAWVLFVIIMTLTLITLRVSGRLVYYAGEARQ
jgi:multiple sugar transport system permease protein